MLELPEHLRAQIAPNLAMLAPLNEQIQLLDEKLVELARRDERARHNTTGTYGNVIRTLIPLVIREEELEEGLDVLEEAGFGLALSRRRLGHRLLPDPVFGTDSSAIL